MIPKLVITFVLLIGYILLLWFTNQVVIRAFNDQKIANEIIEIIEKQRREKEIIKENINAEKLIETIKTTYKLETERKEK